MKIARIKDNKLYLKGAVTEAPKKTPLLYFNGASQAVTIANTNNRLQPSNTFTWEMWFRLDGYTQYNTLMAFGGNNYDFGRMDATTRFRCHIYDVNGSQRFVTPSGFQPVDDGEWHHMAIVWDGRSGERFALIDGIQRDYGTMTTGSQPRDLSSQATFTIGGATPNGRLINGWIKDVRMWQIARTQQEIVGSMDIELNGNEEGLLLYLPLNEGKGDVVLDKASGYVADLGGAIWEVDSSELRLDTLGNLTTLNEIIEYPIGLEGGRNLLPTKYESFVVNDGTYGWIKLADEGTPLTVKVYDTGADVDMGSTYFGLTNIGKNYTGGGSFWLMANGDLSRTEGQTEEALYFSFYPRNRVTFDRIFEKYKIKVETGDKNTPWTPAPEDLGLEYSSDIQYFNMGIKGNTLMVTELIEGGV